MPGPLVYSEIVSAIEDLVQSSASTDNPLTADATLLPRFINRAYRAVWEMSGGALKKVASATAWTSAQTATGVVTGLLTDIDEVLHVFASSTSGSTGFSAGDVELNKADYSLIQGLRATAGYGSYTNPKMYTVTRLDTVTPGNVGLVQLDYWPSVTGFYLPIHYVPMLTPIDAVTVTTPNVNDLESQDIAYIAAAELAPLLGRAELVMSLLSEMSENAQKIMARRLSSMLDAKQDK